MLCVSELRSKVYIDICSTTPYLLLWILFRGIDVVVWSNETKGVNWLCNGTDIHANMYLNAKESSLCN